MEVKGVIMNEKTLVGSIARLIDSHQYEFAIWKFKIATSIMFGEKEAVQLAHDLNKIKEVNDDKCKAVEFAGDILGVDTEELRGERGISLELSPDAYKYLTFAYITMVSMMENITRNPSINESSPKKKTKSDPNLFDEDDTERSDDGSNSG